MRKLNSLSVVLWVLLSAYTAGRAIAQDPVLQHYLEQYPGEKTILQKSVKRVVYDIVNNALTVREEIEYVQYHMDALNALGEELSYDSFSRIYDIKAFTEVPKGNAKTKRVVTKEFSERDDFTDGIFHDDIRTISFRYPRAQAGDRTVLTYKREFSIPQISSRHFFISATPAELIELIVDKHPAVQVELKFFNCSADDFEITQTTRKGREITYYKQKQLSGVTLQRGATSISDWAPHIVVYTRTYEVKGEEVSVLRDVGDLFAWYDGMIDQIAACDLELIPSVTDELLDGATSDEEKYRRIFRYVQDRIKYVAFEDGLGGLIPRNANDVLNKRFGDCKDMSNLMYAMCLHAGLPAYLTWVGTREIPYSYHELPTPSVDNHMILVAGDLEQPYWLDATSSTGEFGVPTSFIQGKEALVRVAKGAYRIIPVPEMAPNYNAVEETISLRLDDGVLLGDSELRLRGAYRAGVVSDFRNISRNSQRERDFLNGYLRKGNNKFKLKQYDLSIPDEHAGELVVRHDFQLDDYAFYDDREVIINLNLNRFYENDKLKADRVQPREFRFRSQTDQTIRFAVPQGYTVGHLPENRSFEKENFGFNFSYTQDGDELIYTQQVTINTSVIRPNEFEDWNTMIDEMKRAYRDAVVLKRKTEH